MTKVYFPREIFPFAVILVSFVDFAVGSVVLAGLMLWYHIPVHWTLLFLPVVIVVHVVFTAGVALRCSRWATSFYRDVKYLFEIVIMLWMFGTSVVYPVSRVGGSSARCSVLNPMTPIIDAYRSVVLHGELPGPRVRLGGRVLVRVALIASWLAFHQRPSSGSRSASDGGADGSRSRGIWKKFRRGERHDSLRDLIPSDGARDLPPPSGGRSPGEEFWALRGRVVRGRPRPDALGIIGPNGAGKSTVLKLLCRLMRPTRGQTRVDGRIGALIEVGGSFHPDLTGRENVFLKGSIMGMKQADIARRFDEIVEFAGPRRVHRHAGQALLERHGRAARLLDRRTPRRRGAADRRGAGGGRCGVPAQGVRPHGRNGRARRAHDHRLAPARARGVAVQPRDPPQGREARCAVATAAA